ncbi:MAG: hypothetical protein AB1410_08765 [Acidobacteriota bacterium]
MIFSHNMKFNNIIAKIPLIKKEESSFSYFLKLGENITYYDWLEQLQLIIDKENSKYYVASLFTRICMSCRSGFIIKELKELYNLNNNLAYFLIIVSRDFNEKDIKNLKENLGIEFSVIRADKKLAKRWNQLRDRYDLNYLVFVINENGDIINIMDTRSPHDVFIYLRRILTS